jgi:hypothetical protein
VISYENSMFDRNFYTYARVYLPLNMPVATKNIILQEGEPCLRFISANSTCDPRWTVNHGVRGGGLVEEVLASRTILPRNAANARDAPNVYEIKIACAQPPGVKFKFNRFKKFIIGNIKINASVSYTIHETRNRSQPWPAHVCRQHSRKTIH